MTFTTNLYYIKYFIVAIADAAMVNMQSGTPIEIAELARHIERLNANNRMLFFQEYEVSIAF
jgi:hypothetical protein